MLEVVPDAREVRLTQLLNRLNDMYGLELARWHDEDRRAAVTVSRGSSIADVLVAVSCDTETGAYLLAAFTSAGWAEYDVPFTCTERDALERAARFVLQYVPETPCT